MDLVTIIIIAIGLGMDAFSVSVGIGAASRRITSGRVLRLAGSFGLFQFVMPLLGWMAGRTVADYISRYDHWIAFLLLALVGGKMIRESFELEKERASDGDPTRGWMLMLLSVATSIDALAVGLSLAFLNAPVFLASIVIGIVCFLMTAAGMIFGRKLGSLFGRKAEFAGGLVLIAIGLNILWEHLK